jgi:hypothetical protein
MIDEPESVLVVHMLMSATLTLCYRACLAIACSVLPHDVTMMSHTVLIVDSWQLVALHFDLDYSGQLK